MLYRPLFWTAFWCEDWLRASAYRGASCVLISSASAKTAFCLAYLINKRAGTCGAGKIEVIGLTSGRNLDFTRDLGLYDHVIEYDAIEQSNIFPSVNRTWLYVDVTGNDDLNTRIQRLFRKHSSNTLAGCIQLGLTNLSPTNPLASTIKFSTNTGVKTSSQTGANNPIALEQFFMPEWLAVRRRQLTVSQITTMQVAAWRNLLQDGSKWVNIVRVNGPTAVEMAYYEVAGRGLDPKTGMIWSLWEDDTGFDRGISPKL
ncbi:hypothetical protein EIP86_009691 [Pleurotus ostreatoroseus]|nr:hypothetical protein EIP86_009691 [Pleurotus ostreatoroseus]